MAIFPILKALVPLVANAGEIVARVRSVQSLARAEDRLKALEEETLRAGRVLTGVTGQLQAVAQEVAAQAEQCKTQQKQVRAALVLASVALALAVAALAVAVFT